MARRPELTPGGTPAVLASSKRLPSPSALGPLIPRARPHVGKLVIAGVTLVLSVAAGLAFPRVVQYLLDAAFVSRDAALLNRIALGLIALFAVQGALNFVQVYCFAATAERVIAGLRQDLFAHLVRLSPGFFTERRTGELTSRLTTDVTMLQSVFTYQAPELARQVLTLVGGIIMLALTHRALTVTTLAAVPIVVGAAVVFGRRLRRASTGVQDQIAEATATAEEAFSQIRTVHSFVREDEETRRYGAHLADVITAALGRARIRAAFFGTITFVAFGAIVAVLWQGGRLVIAGTLTAGALVGFMFYAFYVAAAVGALASLFGSYQEAVGAARRVFELMDTPSPVRESASPRPLPTPVRGDVVVDRVSFTYAGTSADGAGAPPAQAATYSTSAAGGTPPAALAASGPKPHAVLHDVSLRIAPGEVVALVGPSGAGKTTIASLIPRFWDVTAGRITLDGVDVRDLRLADLRGAIGIVPQEPSLFSGTVRENIAYARPDASDAAVLAAARAAHAWEFIERLPQGLDTRVGERGVKLSGGQRQRIAIARVVLKDPAVVILDEATSSLDSESERLVGEAMEDLLRGRSTLIIAHRLSTVRRADRVVVIDHGRVVEEGSHTALLAGDGIYAKLYRGQYAEPSVLERT